MTPTVFRFPLMNGRQGYLSAAMGVAAEYRGKWAEVSEERLVLQIGYPWYIRCFLFQQLKPIRVVLSFISNDGLADSSTMQADQLTVTIQPGSSGWNSEDFQQISRKIVWAIRTQAVVSGEYQAVSG